jgi:hypothetical protein
MDKKQFMRLAFAGLLVGRVVPAVSAPSDVASDVDAALQQARNEARSEQPLTIQDIDSLASEDDPVALY